MAESTDIERYLVRENTRMIEAMETIDRGAKGAAVVIDSERHVVGIVTDSDRRRRRPDRARHCAGRPPRGSRARTCAGTARPPPGGWPGAPRRGAGHRRGSRTRRARRR